MRRFGLAWRLLCVATLGVTNVPAAEVQLNGKTFQVADGWSVELAATIPLTERPICVDFDEAGHLYVAESSGTNDPVQKQLEDRPHTILRLTDTDGDGVYDQRTIFADNFMFPEGCAWHDGSLYVAAPPQIWKLTDTNGDGVADERVVWFDGNTLTGCANDLHGPYLGPDGQLYWCKGAFAEQTYERPRGESYVTRASHIFRHEPQEQWIEPVMTGGMDNPVELAFTRSGDSIMTCTFLQIPGGGQRDGLIHTVYGGLWGKQHGVLDGHRRTGELMPPLLHMGAAAPAGLWSVQSDDWDAPETVLACSFNLHKVTRHVLTPKGATFEATMENLFASEDVDFHPTDVIEDADGSLLVVDTGGWYKLCCPTSQLHKPDVRGAIYRLRHKDQATVADPRGLKLEWNEASSEELVVRLADDRFAVRQRAMGLLAKRSDAVSALASALKVADAERDACQILWTLTRINTPEARSVVRGAIGQLEGISLQIALRSSGMWRDANAKEVIAQYLTHENPHTARAAAEALGRIGKADTVPALLTLAGRADEDRFLFHAATYALLEIGDPRQTRERLQAKSVGEIRAALLVLDQIPGGELAAGDVIPFLDHAELRETALSIATGHPEWGGEIAEYLRDRLSNPTAEDADSLRQLAATVATQPEVETLLASVAQSSESQLGRRIAYYAMSQSGLKTLPAGWGQAIAAGARASNDEETLAGAIEVARRAENLGDAASEVRKALESVAKNQDHEANIRLLALQVSAKQMELDDELFAFVLDELTDGETVSGRLLAADVLNIAKLSVAQFQELAEMTIDLGPMELDRVLTKFTQTTDDETGKKLVAALEESESASALPAERIQIALSKFGPEIQEVAKPLLERPMADATARAAELEERLKLVANGDIRRGQAVFHSSKAACASCHAIGYVGGTVGPDLTRIGKIRTERDLLEAILFPSVSFVRSYEPVTIVTVDGQVFQGVPQEQSGDSITLVMAADKSVTIPQEEIEEMHPSSVSIMPAGLEKQLSPQELADLVLFLKSAQ